MDEKIQANMMNRIALGDCLRRTAKRYPNHTALKYGERAVSFKALDEMANQFGRSLLNQNFPKGTKIAFVAPNSIEFFIAFFGIAKAGLIMVPINPIFKKEEMAFAVNDSDCEAFIFDGNLYGLIKDAFDAFKKVKTFIAFNTPSDQFSEFYEFMKNGEADEIETFIEDRDVVVICYTGGTTSFPKGAQLTHLSIFTNANSLVLDCPFRSTDKYGIVLPLFHVATMVSSMWTLLTGGCNVLIPQVDPKAIMDTIEQEKLTFVMLMPPLLRSILSSPEFGKYDFSSLRLVGYFGAVMPETLMHEVMDKFCPNLMLSFGQTEMSPCVTAFTPEQHLKKPKSLGMSTIHCEIEVMDDNGNLLPRGEIGEFVYRSPSVMKGYYGKPEYNKEAFAGGWFHSGDLGYLDEDGFLFFVDRKKDMIKTGGENVASIEVEKTIFLDPRVMEVHVVGLPHERWSEAVTALVVPKAGETIQEEEIIGLCKEKMAGFKVPKRVIFLEELPKSPVGKVLKYKMKEQYKDLYTE